MRLIGEVHKIGHKVETLMEASNACPHKQTGKLTLSAHMHTTIPPYHPHPAN